MRDAIRRDFTFGGYDFLNPLKEPGVEARNCVDFGNSHAFAQGLSGDQKPVRRRTRQGRCQLVLRRAFQFIDVIEADKAGVQPAQGLLHRFMDVAPNRHHFTDRLHRRRQDGFGALELFKGKARDFGHDIVDRRFKRRRRRARNVVVDLIERIAHGQLGRDLGNREAGCLGGQRRGARHARVHFNHDQAAILRIDCELNVGTACFHTDFTQAGDACVAHDLIFFVGQRQRWRDGDRVAGMDAHRVDILDRTDDDGIIVPVADDLHLIFFPAEQRLFDQHFGGGRGIKPACHDLDKLFAVIGNAATGAAHGEARANNGRKASAFQHRQRFLKRVRNARPRRFQTDLVHRIAELDAVFRLVDSFGVGTDHFHAVLGERAIIEQRERGVERSLPAHGRQDRVGPLLLDDLRHDFGRDRLDIGRIRQLGISHDRRRVRIDEDDAIALLLQRLHGLRARIIELARLPDNDRTRAYDEDGGDVCSFRHFWFPSSPRTFRTDSGCPAGRGTLRGDIGR